MQEKSGSDDALYKNSIKDVLYNPDKDFYKGISGELRLKAEGLFKKAKEKGISIDEIDISQLDENQSQFPGIGEIKLPAFIVKVKGKNIQTGQTVVDGKQIDYYNMYQKYYAEKIENKNIIRDEKGRIIKENGRSKVKKELELSLTDWDIFEIGKDILDSKEFGLEKTITGACDRVIRKLMGENDWIYAGEAKLLDDEFREVQKKILIEQELKKNQSGLNVKKATERQINYLKAKIRNLGLDSENEPVMNEIIKQFGFEAHDIRELSTIEVSKIIDDISSVIGKVKEAFAEGTNAVLFEQKVSQNPENVIKQYN